MGATRRSRTATTAAVILGMTTVTGGVAAAGAAEQAAATDHVAARSVAAQAGGEEGELALPWLERHGGADRYETAALVAAQFPGEVDTVYVASGTAFADALSAASPAGSGGAATTQETVGGMPAPVLLTRSDDLPDTTAQALTDLAPSRIVILGGTEAVSSEVQTTLATYGQVERIGGPDRYATSALLAQQYPSGVETVYLASGADRSFPDALTGGALAGRDGAPILLTRPDRVDPATQRAIDHLDADTVVVLGGPVAVTDTTFEALGADTRIAGADRYGTAVAVSARFDPQAESTMVASGRSWPDALAGSALAGFLGVPVQLTEPDELPDEVLAELYRLSPTSVDVLGGSEAISDEVWRELNADYLDGLRWTAPEGFLIGSAAAGGGHHLEQDYPVPFPHDERYRAVLATEFSSLTPENQLKWSFLRPDQETYRFGPADAIVQFAQENGQEVRGHALLWHSQNPAWLEEGDFTDEELRELLREHIFTVVGRYEGQIYQWDVANEIFDDEGNLRLEENIWLRELGPGIIADAFRWAHEADPGAQLYVNDYNVEGINAKSDAYYALITDLLEQGVPVHGFSAQAHLSLLYGFDTSLQANLQRFDDLGLETAITELDVRIPLGDDGVPTPAQLQTQAERYQLTMDACLAVQDCTSLTLWGLPDQYSWVPHFFAGEGAATVLWEDFTTKPAYDALQDSVDDLD